MAFEVRIEPSGHRFTAMPQETLLEAALRAGISINYNCSSGTCGDCKVRLLSGEVEQSVYTDYQFSQQQRNDGYILACANRAASDLVIQAEEAHSPGDIPVQQITSRVSKLEEPSPEVRILHLRTPRTRTLRFMAGQHLRLTLPGVGSYDAAIASCPCNGMHLQFHLPRNSEEPFVEAVFAGLRSGQTVELEGPYGDITLDDDSPRPLMMVAMGTDFAPIKSLIEHAINLDLRQPIRLIWLAPRSQGHYLSNYCRSWEDVLDDYRFTPLSMAGLNPEREELTRLREVIGEQAAGLGQLDAYLSGSSLFREVAREHLLTLGSEAVRIFELRRRNLPRPQRLAAHP